MDLIVIFAVGAFVLAAYVAYEFILKPDLPEEWRIDPEWERYGLTWRKK